MHKCSGASSGNIFGMFLAETGVLVLLSVLFSFLLIINMGELIEDLLGTSLASLFAWDIIWIPLLTVVVLFLLAGGIPGKLFSRIPVTQVFRHYTDGKKRMETFITICPVHGYLLCTRTIAGYPVTIFSPDEWRYGNQDSGTGRSQNLDVRRNSRTCKRRVAPPTDGGRVSASTHSVLGEYWTRGLIGNDGKRMPPLISICATMIIRM